MAIGGGLPMPESVLTEGEWRALLYQCPDQVRPLVVRLAVFHGAMAQPSDPETCPCCGGAKPEKQEGG